MVTYTVHEPPAPSSDRIDRGTELEFVKDGFSWLTAIFPPIGLIANGLWLFAFAYLVVAGGLGWALQAAKVDSQWTGIIFLLLNIFIGLEISTFKRWMLEQTGWRTLGVVTGGSIGECERRFLESWLPGQPIIANGTPEAAAGLPVMPVRRGSRFWPFGSGA